MSNQFSQKLGDHPLLSKPLTDCSSGYTQLLSQNGFRYTFSSGRPHQNLRHMGSLIGCGSGACKLPTVGDPFLRRITIHVHHCTP